MSRGISVTIAVEPAGVSNIDINGKRRPEQIVHRIMQDRLQEALLRIKRYWPIRTGRSFQAWNIYSPKLMAWVISNQASSDYGEYAGYVHRKGEKTPLIDTLIPKDIAQAAREIKTEITVLRATGKATQLPTLTETTKDRLRAAIARKLLERTRRN